MIKLRLMADYECYPLWVSEPGKVLNVNPEKVPISVGLVCDLREWSSLYDATLNREDPARSGFDSAEEEREFKRSGEILARRLQDELGMSYEIEYFGR